MASAVTYIPRYTSADYLNWEGEWELWDGIPVAMSPSPNFHHQSIGGKLFVQLSNQLAADDCEGKCEALYELDWHVTESTIVRPDLMVICGKPEGQWVEANPEMIVEILSPSTREKDLVSKRELYAANGVAFYLIVDPENKSVVLLKLDEEGTYREVGTDQPFSIHSNCSLRISPEELFG